MKPDLEKNIPALLLLIALLIGSWLRLTPAFLAGFPINDGGMFYTMIGDLQNNGYALPAFTSYNRAENIPFAYPPFPFYLAALLSTFFHFSAATTLLWLPALISITVILAFYFLARSILNSPLQAALAVLFFSLTPRTISWFLMGGGLTRSFGQLFLMLTAISAYQLFTQKKRRYLIFTILAGTLAVLSHPEAAVHSVGISLLLWWFYGRERSSLLNGAIVALGVGLLSATWWLPVILQHGLTPFLNAAQTGNHSISAWVPLLTFNFTEEPLVPLIAVIGLIGLFITIKRRNFFFVAWFILPFIMEPRSAPWILTMPLTMLTGIALTDLLLPGLASIGSNRANPVFNPFRAKIVLLFLGFITAYSLLGAYAFTLKMGGDHLSNSDEKAMKWVSQNTPANSRFIILTGTQDPMHDPVQEWFPALTGRVSATTLQGREWTRGKDFIPSIATYAELQTCITSTLECFEQKARTIGIDYEYIYVSIQSENSAIKNTPIIDFNENKPIYTENGIYIFQGGLDR